MDCNLSGSSDHGIFPARILVWVAISFSRGIFPTQGLNPGLLHCRQMLYHLSHQGSSIKGNQPLIFIERTDAETSSNTTATWCWEATHWKRPWCWERLRTGEQRCDRGWDSLMASLTQWTWLWANSRRQWRTGNPGMLQFMGPRVTDDWAVEQHLP